MSSNSSAYGGSSSSSSAAILTEQFSNGALRLVSVASPAVAWSAVGLPFDVIRHRLQVSSTSVTSIRGPIDCLQYTIRTEGVRALWSGLLPTLLMQVPYATIMFGTFETFRPSKKNKEQSQSNEQGNTRTYYSKVFLAGSAAGVPLTVLANPLDVWRTRVQTMGFTTSTSGSLANSSVVKVDAPPTAASSSSSSRQQTCTTRTSGASAASASSSSRSRSIFKALQLEKRLLARGSSMTLIRNGPGNGFFFLFNEVLNDIQLPIQNVSLKKFVTGGLTGILFNILLHPVDVVKARLMVSDVKTISQVVAEVYKDMGFRGFLEEFRWYA